MLKTTDNMMKIFDYEDIQLIPGRCVVSSRGECDTSVRLGDYNFKLPIVPANMRSIVDENLCLWLAENDFFYIMHRFDTDALKFTEMMQQKNLIASISVGIKPVDYQIIDSLISNKMSPEFITIDIAHGHCDGVKKMLRYIKSKLNSFIIAGNVGTPSAVADLERWGADAVKVGIGPGSVCTTKLKTGFGTGGWQLSALAWCSNRATKPIIADGGIRSNGDIPKSIRFGATMVMIGGLLAGHHENPSLDVTINDVLHKEYYGSASEHNKYERKNVEGKKIMIEHRGNIKDTYQEMMEDLQSAISYAGGKTLKAITTCDYVSRKKYE